MIDSPGLSCTDPFIWVKSWKFCKWACVFFLPEVWCLQLSCEESEAGNLGKGPEERDLFLLQQQGKLPLAVSAFREGERNRIFSFIQKLNQIYRCFCWQINLPNVKVQEYRGVILCELSYRRVISERYEKTMALLFADAFLLSPLPPVFFSFGALGIWNFAAFWAYFVR